MSSTVKKKLFILVDHVITDSKFQQLITPKH